MERIPEKKPFSLLPPCVCSSKNLSKPWDAWNGTKLKWRRMEVAETGRDGNAYTHTHTHTWTRGGRKKDGSRALKRGASIGRTTRYYDRCILSIFATGA